MLKQLARLAAVAAAACAGCSSGDNAAPVSGRIVKAGVPFRPAATPGRPAPPGEKPFRIFFTSLDGPAKGEEYSADVDYAAGTFTVAGRTARGVTPGRYRVAVFVGALSAPGAAVAEAERKRAGAANPGAPAGPTDTPVSMYGKEQFKAEVDVPESGLSGYVIEMK